MSKVEDEDGVDMCGTGGRRVISQIPGKVYQLREVLREWGIGSDLTNGIAPEWECEIIQSPESNAEMATLMARGKPFLAPTRFAEDAHKQVGEDALRFLTDERWNKFKGKPKMAMVGGWGQPGSSVYGEEHLALVKSFSGLLADSRPINLQMFHRGLGGVDGKIPHLPALLRWPLEDIFHRDTPRAASGALPTSRPLSGAIEDSDGIRIRNDRKGMSVNVDMATRISKRGAFTWWHLDDGGEFTFQTGLPISTSSSSSRRSLYSATGKKIVKLFIFLPKEAYPLVFQDAVTNKSQTFALLDIFRTPSIALPSEEGGESKTLPRIMLAPLEAGGRPLLSVPNVPHAVLTLEDCVMVEQRRILKLFMDEVFYFMERRRHWRTEPILYKFITDGLQDESFVESAVVDLLVTHIVADDTDETDCDSCRLRRVVDTCARQSLTDLLRAERRGMVQLSDKSRARVETLLASAERGRTLVSNADDRYKKQTKELADFAHPVLGVTKMTHMMQVSVDGCGDEKGTFAGYCHVGGRARWGPCRESMALALHDRSVMMKAVGNAKDEKGDDALFVAIRKLRDASASDREERGNLLEKLFGAGGGAESEEDSEEED